MNIFSKIKKDNISRGTITSQGNLLVNPGFETGTFAPWVNTDNCASNQIQSGIVHSGTYALQMDSIYSPYPDYKYVVQTLGVPPSLADDIVLSVAIYPTKTGPTCGQAGVAWIQVMILDIQTEETTRISYEWSGYTYPGHDIEMNETWVLYLFFDWNPNQWHMLYRSLLSDYAAVFGMPANPSQLRVTKVSLLNHAANGEPGTFYADDLFLGPSDTTPPQGNLLVNPGFETGAFAPWVNTDNCASNQIQSEIVYSGTYALQMDSIYSPYPDYKYVDQTLRELPSLMDDLVLSAAIYPTKTGPTCGQAGVAWIQVEIVDTTTYETTTINYEWSGYTYPNHDLGMNETKAGFLLFDWEPYHWHLLHRSLLADYTAVFGMPSNPGKLRVIKVALLNHASNGEPGTFYVDDLFLGLASFAPIPLSTITSHPPLTSTEYTTNTAPTVLVIRPNGGERVRGIYEIKWSANDLDGDFLTFTISYSPNRGETWTQIANGVTETSYQWDTSTVEVGSNYLIKIEVSDRIHTVEDHSDTTFTIDMETSSETSPGGELFIPSFESVESISAILVLLWLVKRRQRMKND